VDEWVAFELNHLLERWAGLFRGEARSKPANELTEDDKANYNLVMFGTPASNSAIAEFFATPVRAELSLFFLPSFVLKKDHFAKTGSRQTRTASPEKDRVCVHRIYPSPGTARAH